MYNIDKSELMHNHGNLQARDGILNTCGGGGLVFYKKTTDYYANYEK